MSEDFIFDDFVSNNLHVFVIKVSYRFIKNYNYLIVDQCSGQAVIVDPAWEMEKLDCVLAETDAALKGILITHSHPDHLNLAEPLSRKYDCPIWMSREEIGYSNFMANHLVGVDRTSWQVGGMTIKPIFTPGHTPGCLCYLIGQNLFTGDVLFAEGCGLCPDEDAAFEMFDSLEYLKNIIHPHVRVFPGHSYGKPPGQYFSSLLKENMYLQFEDRDMFVAFRMRSGQNKAKMLSFS